MSQLIPEIPFMASLWIRSGCDMKVDPSVETYQVGVHFKALMKAILVAPSRICEKFFSFSGSFFVRFGKNSISSKAKKLDFYQKLDSKSQKTRFWVIKLLPKVFKFYNFQVKVALKK